MMSNLSTLLSIPIGAMIFVLIVGGMAGVFFLADRVCG